ncbi:hypothetical protein V6N12_025791 [Hibiscus sabdariffa]|uniref:Uncharacterized protein n=1 Tax=Hibiscus sabdariffa TaxID=183260 RepID=A0ABR2AIR0_9ROSI
MEFVNTSLHVSTASGNTGFAMEMMSLKPSFARKLNQDGFSPIHLALLKDHADTVAEFVSVDRDLIRVKGREGFTVLHYVACHGNDKDGNTVLHLAAANNQPKMNWGKASRFSFLANDGFKLIISIAKPVFPEAADTCNGVSTNSISSIRLKTSVSSWISLYKASTSPERAVVGKKWWNSRVRS